MEKFKIITNYVFESQKLSKEIQELHKQIRVKENKLKDIERLIDNEKNKDK